MLHDKEKDESKIIDISCLLDGRVIDTYEDLRTEMSKLWNVRKVVKLPIVIGALGTLCKKFKKQIEGIEMRQESSLQKTLILGTAKIIRGALDT